MLTRIVKMEFRQEEVASFLRIFDEYRDRISNVPGVRSVKLQKDISTTNRYFTISAWENAHALENYRKSELFNEVWSKVKPLFAAKAEAWTLSD